MPTLCAVIETFVASREPERATLARLDFWIEIRGVRELSAITPEDFDAALVRLSQRGRLVPRRGKETLPSGAPLAGSTFNCYISPLGSVYRCARRLRLLLRAYLLPVADAAAGSARCPRRWSRSLRACARRAGPPVGANPRVLQPKQQAFDP